MPQIQPEALYAIIAVLVMLCILLGLTIAAYLGSVVFRKAVDSKFGNPDRYVIDEVKSRITKQRRDAAVDALIEELKPGEVVVEDE